MSVVDLRGTGVKSYFMGLRADAIANAASIHPRSDELRIYDLDHGDLHLAFDFRPHSPTGKQPGRAYEFSLHGIRDYEHNSRPEIIGAYQTLFMGPSIPRPVGIFWDDGRERYRIAPLLAAAPRFQFTGPAGAYGKVAKELYAQPALLKDKAHHIRFRAYGTEAFGLRSRGFLAMIAAFIVHDRSHADPPLYEIDAWQINFQLTLPQVAKCEPIPPKPVLTMPPRIGFPDEAFFVRTWTHATRWRVSCG